MIATVLRRGIAAKKSSPMDAVAALMFALVFGLTLLPLAVILPSAPPMTDDASPRPRRAGWRITLSVARTEPG